MSGRLLTPAGPPSAKATPSVGGGGSSCGSGKVGPVTATERGSLQHQGEYPSSTLSGGPQGQA